MAVRSVVWKDDAVGTRQRRAWLSVEFGRWGWRCGREMVAFVPSTAAVPVEVAVFAEEAAP